MQEKNLIESVKVVVLSVIVVVLIVSILLLQYYVPDPKNEPERLNSESVSAGVVVHGYMTHGWVKNTNDFSVSVKHVEMIRINDHEESIKFIKVFQPNEIINTLYISSKSRFYISTLDGAEIGWIKPVRNGLKG